MFEFDVFELLFLKLDLSHANNFTIYKGLQCIIFQFVPHVTMALTVTVRAVSAEEMMRVTM